MQRFLFAGFFIGEVTNLALQLLIPESAFVERILGSSFLHQPLSASKYENAGGSQVELRQLR